MSEQVICRMPVVFKPFEISVVPSEGDKKPLEFPIYWKYEVFDPNDGRGETRVSKR